MRDRLRPRWAIPAILFAAALSANAADIPLVPGTLSPLFGAGLVPEYRESGIVFPAEAREDPATGAVVWFNALGNPFWFVPGDRAAARTPWRVPPALAAAATRSIGRQTFRHASGDARLPAASGGASPPGEPDTPRGDADGRRNGEGLSGIPGSRSLGSPLSPTNLLLSAFSHTGTSVLLRADWPAADNPLPENALDLYLKTNLLDEAWTLLRPLPVPTSSTNLSAEIPGAEIPGFFRPGHVHDASCPVLTNLYPDPLTGLVETGLVYRCRLSPVPPGAFFRLGTRHDADFDGLPDAYEALASLTDPLDPDTDNDGVPDGLTRGEWLAHPLWAAPGDDGNLLVESIAPLPTNSTAILLLDDLAIPLAGPLPMLSFRLPPGRIVSCTLHSEETTLLWCSVPGSEYPSGGGLWSSPVSSPEPLWCDTPSSVFGPRTSGGSCSFAVPVLTAEPEGDLARHSALRSAGESLCVHSAPGAAFYRWSVSPALLADFVTNTEALVSAGPGRVSLSVSSPGETASGELVLTGGTPPLGHDALWGDVRLRLSAHGCLGGTGSPCLACGRVHPAGEPLSCFHEPGCAARAYRDAPCTCPPPFVRIGREGALRLAGLDSCCCLPIEAGEPPELLSAASSLGASVSNDWLIVQPFSPSPSVTGFPVRVRFYGDDGEEWRDLGFGVVAADLGIEPQSLSGAPAPPGEDALVHFFTGGTLHLARRAAPYPLSVWNQSPPDGRLEFAYLCSSNGPSLSCGGLALDAPAAFTNAPPLAAPNSAAIALLDASRSGTASLALTLSDPATNRTILSESLSVQVIDTALGEHWRVRSTTDSLSWDFSDAPTNVWVGIGHADENGVLTNTIAFSESRTPSLSLDLSPGDYDLEAYFPRVWDGDSPVHSTTGMVHIVRTEVTPTGGLRFTNAVERACFALTNNNGQAANWTISPVVAGGPTLFSSKTAGSGSSTLLDHATSVWVRAGSTPGTYTLTATHPHCPASTTNATFTVGLINVDSLIFNWDTTSSVSDAINLRWNYTNEINLVTGEWTRAGYHAPACYTTNLLPTVRATFSVAPADLSSVTLLAETDAAIGGFAATNVAFAGGTASDVGLLTKSATTNCILRESFDLTWKAVVSNETEVVTNTLGKTNGHVLYTIFHEPLTPWKRVPLGDSQNAWASALDFALVTAGAGGSDSETNALAAITQHLFSGHGLVYDTKEGRPTYFTNSTFRLSSYMLKTGDGNTNRPPETVNCLDQALAVTTFSSLLGIDSNIQFLEPFGYLNIVDLVGIGSCNNPFFAASGLSKTNAVEGVDDDKRSSFIRHFYAKSHDVIFDACAGPALGTQSNAEYLDAVVDTSTPDEKKPAKYGSVECGLDSRTMDIGRVGNIQ